MASPGEVVDTVIIGNGPSALILSYILHGHIPYYTGGHADHRLNEKLKQSPDLTHVAHNVHTYLSSDQHSQALPMNVLLDSLIRPNGDTDISNKSCVEWRSEPERAISHLVLGSAPHPGGQWVDNPVRASWDIGTLSYAEQLNMPGYSMAQFWRDARREPMPDLIRPTRNDVTDYLRAYPAAVGISKEIRSSAKVSSVSRKNKAFYIEPFGITCKHVVLATGIFNINLPPPSFLSPLATLDAQLQGPLLVIGSGFTAADIIISTPPDRKIIHLFNWDPANRPSPLKACHGSAYPEYAWIYRQMKLAVERSKTHHDQRKGSLSGIFGKRTPKSSSLYFTQRNWQATYEGYPNSRIIGLDLNKHDAPAPAPAADGANANGTPRAAYRSAFIQIGRLPTSPAVTRTITSFHYAVGRRGSLSYLSPPLLQEILSLAPEAATAAAGADPLQHDFARLAPATASALISRLSLRDKIDAPDPDTDDAAGFELAPDVFAVGSLSGDSLIRYAYGGCVAVAGAIARRQQEQEQQQLDRRKD